MDQPTHHKPRFEVIEPSMVGPQFATKHDSSSFSSSYVKQQSNDQIQLRTVDEADQISIFDAAKYFSGLHDETHDHASLNTQKPAPKLILELSSMARLSSVSSSIDNQSNYRARSFHATPTASSEASWNSQTGLLSNRPVTFGIKIHSFSHVTCNTNNSKTVNTTKWQRINPKWLIPCRKCPCSGKKSVQVEERIESKTPRMVDLRRSYSSNDTNSSSIHCTKLKSPQKSTPTTISLPSVPLPQVQDPCNGKYSPNLIRKHNKHSNGISPLTMNPKSIVPIPLKLSASTNTTSTASSGSNLAKASIVVSGATTTGNGFTFPILEDEPMSVKKMFFNVTTPQNNNQIEPSRDSLEVFQPKSQLSPRSRRISYEEDIGSDGSSDLFEIESFSTTTYPRQCDSIDEANVSDHYNSSVKRFGMVCPSNDMVIKAMSRNSLDENEECYAPSEVSIDWSVTTAEGFDKASFSNFSISASEIGFGGGGGAVVVGGGRKNGSGFSGGGLLSCRCEKAVSVGPGPIKCMIEGGPPIAGRHVGGGPPQQVGQGGGVGGNASGSHGNGKANIIVGRS